MAFRLIPREEKFYDDFTALAEQIRHGAGLLEAMLAPDKPICLRRNLIWVSASVRVA